VVGLGGGVGAGAGAGAVEGVVGFGAVVVGGCVDVVGFAGVDTEGVVEDEPGVGTDVAGGVVVWIGVVGEPDCTSLAVPRTDHLPQTSVTPLPFACPADVSPTKK
jgi:hypothetical protein